MTAENVNQDNMIEILEDGLILRTATPEDSDALAQFNGKIHVDPGEEFVDHIAHWTRDLLSGTHPTTGPKDFTIVEDTATGEIVSTLCLIDQTWAYEGIEFSVGRPELVATREDYRRRGLVRKQFDVIHQWSKERGHKLQFITGIPWYYRQFGYEMAVNLGGRRMGEIQAIPKLKKNEEEVFNFRTATEMDIPFIADLYETGAQRSLLKSVRDDALWRYELNGRHPKGSLTLEMTIIETAEGNPIGYMFNVPVLWDGRVYVRGLELVKGRSWLEISSSVLRHIQRLGEKYVAEGSIETEIKELTGYCFDLGEDHPIYHIIPNKMPLKLDPYAYYIRVPDLPDFLGLIKPVLEERLAESYMAGHSGELKLNFFQTGINMVFEKGRIKILEPWDKPNNEDAWANFPDLTFLQLVFGHRDVQQLEDAYPDLYYTKDGSKYLLSALFPRKPSKVMDFG
jgi:hypothetical protein